MSAGATVAGFKATTIVARLTLKRLFRSKGIWFTFALSLLPILIATIGSQDGEEPKKVWDAVFGVGLLVYCIAPPIHLASTIAEEIEDKTFTYLWSRPFPRWAVITGKILALLPALCLLFTISFGLSFYLSYGGAAGANTNMLFKGMMALWIGMLATSCLCIGLGSLVPRFPLVVSIIYLLIIDAAVSGIPASVNHGSVLYNMTVIAGLEDKNHDTATAVISLLCIGLVWMAVAVYRIGRTEFQTDK